MVDLFFDFYDSGFADENPGQISKRDIFGQLEMSSLYEKDRRKSESLSLLWNSYTLGAEAIDT